MLGKKYMQIAKNLNVSSTPAVFINGKEFNGNTLNDFIEMVEGSEENGE